MPIAKRKVVARKNVRIPEPIVDEVDRIVRENGVYVNRQQFIEAAIRERIEQSKLAERIDGDFAARIKDKVLVHAIVNAVKEKTVPADHLVLEQFERDVRRYVEERAGREGKRLTKERLDELIEDLLEYHKELLDGFSVMASRKRA